ncbi:hypothetical protein EIN_046440 [Entamoeba invadens IP1]|uniref:Uncharacterized protein n=1 Tax=Entamoeba invadens IP1 TaxID=370355 RepID=A0A0A1UDJ5_ENTIV|nr:hypothetical protein EIN_046440 [Entamoeba invadens IP1]ELP94401.1 hypothetical protein EIN_046440 [Entamoeba invadens IP1]|eukprot:XP_004261172.1 hypothetical protein EIN_046440 [Entamoeba invadens IP1]
MFFVLLSIVLVKGAELVKPILTTPSGEMVMFTKATDNECSETLTGSEKLIFVASHPFMLHYLTKDCSGPRVSVDEIDNSDIFESSPKHIAWLNPRPGSHAQHEQIYISDVCMPNTLGASKYAISNNTLYSIQFKKRDCSGESLQSQCVHCGGLLDGKYVLSCGTDALATLFVLALLLSF